MDSVVVHQDYWMRSHSEVRWASMMDALDLRWLYEHKLYQTRHGPYLPDFFLYGAGAYLEVKGPCPSQIEIEKAVDVQRASGHPVVFGWGTMESDINRVNGAKLSFLKGNSVVHIDSGELSPLVEYGLGPKNFYQHLLAAAPQRINPTKSVTDVLRKIIFDLIGRNEMEKDRAQHHAALNSHKAMLHSPRSKAEIAISSFLERRIVSDPRHLSR